LYRYVSFFGHLLGLVGAGCLSFEGLRAEAGFHGVYYYLLSLRFKKHLTMSGELHRNGESIKRLNYCLPVCNDVSVVFIKTDVRAALDGHRLFLPAYFLLSIFISTK
jgi:hypothetical protein